MADGPIYEKLMLAGVTASMAGLIAVAGWVVSLERRVQDNTTQIADRGPRIERLEKDVDALEKDIADPAPKPETRVAMLKLDSDHKQLDARLDRLEERINGLHAYLLLLPRPSPVTPTPFSKRGSLTTPTFSAPTATPIAEPGEKP